MKLKGGEVIKIARKLRGYTQVELAEAYGVNNVTWCRWEKCKTQPSYDTVMDVLEYLGLSMEQVKDAA